MRTSGVQMSEPYTDETLNILEILKMYVYVKYDFWSALEG